MFNKSSLRLALSGSILVILLGSLGGCSEDPTAPRVARQNDTTNSTCTVFNGILQCS